jgi:hypothetical protein
MKTVVLLMVSIFLLMNAGAQTTEFLSTKDFQSEKKKLADGINAAKKTAQDAKKAVLTQNQTLDSLSKLLSVYQAQVAKSNDSIASLSVTVNDLQNQIDQKKTRSRYQLIFAFGFILLLLILSFVIIFMIKKKLDQNILSLSEEGAKTNNKIDQGLNHVSEDVRGCKELIKTSSDDLNQQLKHGLVQFEIRAGHIEQQIKDYTGIIEGKINKTKEENDIHLKKQEDKLNTLQSLVDQKNQEFTTLINSVDKNQKGIAPGIMDDVNALKNQLEEKIKSVAAEISKFKMK